MEGSLLSSNEALKSIEFESKQVEAKKKNVIIFGLKEGDENGKDTDNEAGKDAIKITDSVKVKELLQAIGVSLEYSQFSVLYRVGRNPSKQVCPLIVRFESVEERQRVLSKARNLKSQQKWKNVFIAEDLTKKQYHLERSREIRLKEEAAERNLRRTMEDAKTGMWKIVGGRGQRRLVWIAWHREHQELRPKNMKIDDVMRKGKPPGWDGHLSCVATATTVDNLSDGSSENDEWNTFICSQTGCGKAFHTSFGLGIHVAFTHGDERIDVTRDATRTATHEAKRKRYDYGL